MVFASAQCNTSYIEILRVRFQVFFQHSYKTVFAGKEFIDSNICMDGVICLTHVSRNFNLVVVFLIFQFSGVDFVVISWVLWESVDLFLWWN